MLNKYAKQIYNRWIWIIKSYTTLTLQTSFVKRSSSNVMEYEIFVLLN